MVGYIDFSDQRIYRHEAPLVKRRYDLTMNENKMEEEDDGILFGSENNNE